MDTGATIRDLTVQAYRVPTDAPEADGTAAWTHTDVVVVQVHADRADGIGYTYGHRSAARLVTDTLAGHVVGRSAWDIAGIWHDLVASVRNDGCQGLAAMAVSAVDIALWDLKGRLLGMPVGALLGRVRERVPVYGSGGFTNEDDQHLAAQLGGWARQGMRWVKMKIGREPERDPHRLDVARDAIGPGTGLFVDANGAYQRDEALAIGCRLAEHGVSWFEEPVTMRDVPGLAYLCQRLPPGLAVASGEYCYGPVDAARLLGAQAVHVLQADATRCLGITGLLHIHSLCLASHQPLSTHCAPAIHGAVGVALSQLRHSEYFHDHVRIESLLFEGAAPLVDGALVPDPQLPGLGIQVRTTAAQRWAA